ncbi:hypothetical protein CF326_g1413 [Tilletia indica]|uniref:Uncharacterized protein n=1 Tax=Tilletia indica TaxID=43049 RepID=A0A8T8SPK1_9BASI|nr:hypothetical protein CF326_g1413 [Tilletia indica]KAE8244493.1 hypothetical protein A4X13_0g6556 [Tilletia indica]
MCSCACCDGGGDARWQQRTATVDLRCIVTGIHHKARLYLIAQITDHPHRTLSAPVVLPFRRYRARDQSNRFESITVAATRSRRNRIKRYASSSRRFDGGEEAIKPGGARKPFSIRSLSLLPLTHFFCIPKSVQDLNRTAEGS